MNRNDLVRILSERTGLKPRQTREVLDLLFGTDGVGIIADKLDRGERVSIAGFGTFDIRERSARQLKDPRTGEPRQVPAGRVPVFRPGSGLKARLH